MRKLLLATSALVAFAAPALAAESPIAVNVGGYVDFRAALNHESSKAAESASRKLVGGDFQNEFRVNFEAHRQGLQWHRIRRQGWHVER